MPLNQAFAADAVTNPGGIHLDCAALLPAEADLPAHSFPLGMSFLEGSAAIGGGEDLAPAASAPAGAPGCATAQPRA